MQGPMFRADVLTYASLLLSPGARDGPNKEQDYLLSLFASSHGTFVQIAILPLGLPFRDSALSTCPASNFFNTTFRIEDDTGMSRSLTDMTLRSKAWAHLPQTRKPVSPLIRLHRAEHHTG